MSVDPAKLREAALLLPVDARARLVVDLLDSLATEDGIVDPRDHDAVWGDEIQERVRAIDAGGVRPVPWDEALRRITREE